MLSPPKLVDTAWHDMGRIAVILEQLRLPSIGFRFGWSDRSVHSAVSSTQNDPVLLHIPAQGIAAQKLFMNGEEQPLVEGLSQRQLSRLARLSLLPRDITQAIVDGNQPQSLTGRQLLRHGDIPLCWDKQRKLLEFAAQQPQPSASCLVPAKSASEITAHLTPDRRCQIGLWHHVQDRYPSNLQKLTKKI